MIPHTQPRNLETLARQTIQCHLLVKTHELSSGFYRCQVKQFFFVGIIRSTSVRSQRNSFNASFLVVFCSITVKDVKALLPQINYRVPNMRFLKDKLQVSLQSLLETLQVNMVTFLTNRHQHETSGIKTIIFYSASFLKTVRLNMQIRLYLAENALFYMISWARNLIQISEMNQIKQDQNACFILLAYWSERFLQREIQISLFITP